MTIHKSTLKRRQKAARSNSTKPLMDGEEDEEKKGDEGDGEPDRNSRGVVMLGSRVGSNSEHSTVETKLSPSAK